MTRPKYVTSIKAMASLATSSLMLIYSGLSLAASISAQSGTGLTPAGGGAKSTLFAFSQNNTILNRQQAGPNAGSFQDTVPPGGVAVFAPLSRIVPLNRLADFAPKPRVLEPVPLAMSGVPQRPLVAICVRNDCSYSPSVSPGPQDKLGAGEGADIVLSSSPAEGTPRRVLVQGAAAYIPQGLIGGDRNQTALIAAGGEVGRGIDGKAAGAAFDPFEVSPGDYPYQTFIDAFVQLDGKSDLGGITYFAMDSRRTPSIPTGVETFYERGQSFDEAVWFLHITVNGVLDSPSDLLDPTKLVIDFKINDTYILRPLQSLGLDEMPFTSDDILFTDQVIADAIRDAFTLSNGTATLTSYPLFPTNPPDSPSRGLMGTTTYRVNAPITYGAGVNAALSQIPEPSGLALLGIGILALLVGAARCSGAASRGATASPAEGG